MLDKILLKIDMFFLMISCVLRMIHLNYNEKSTFRFICDLVHIICYIGHLALVINWGMFACILFCTSLGLDSAIAVLSLVCIDTQHLEKCLTIKYGSRAKSQNEITKMLKMRVPNSPILMWHRILEFCTFLFNILALSFRISKPALMVYHRIFSTHFRIWSNTIEYKRHSKC